MAWPALIPIITAVASAVSNKKSADEQQEYQEKLEKADKASKRRAAIERAIGGNRLGRTLEAPKAPDLTPYNTINALAGLGSSLYGAYGR